MWLRCGASALFAHLAKLYPDVEVQHVRLWEDATRKEMEYNLEHVLRPHLRPIAHASKIGPHE